MIGNLHFRLNVIKKYAYSDQHKYSTSSLSFEENNVVVDFVDFILMKIKIHKKILHSETYTSSV